MRVRVRVRVRVRRHVGGGARLLRRPAAGAVLRLAGLLPTPRAKE